MHEHPLVSIVIPTYGRPDCLREAIASAIAQSWKNTEIIVSDDCSPQDPADLVQSFNDPRIRYFRRERNVGQGRNNIGAMRRARGEFIANLHDDDILEPHMLEALVPILSKDHTLSVAFGDQRVIRLSGEIDHRATAEHRSRFGRDRLAAGKHAPFCGPGLVRQSIPMCLGAVFRKSLVDLSDFPEQVDRKCDYWLTYLASREGAGAYFVKEALARYRVHQSSSTSAGGADRDQSYVFCLERMIADQRLHSIHKDLRKKLGIALTGLGIVHLREGHTTLARTTLGRAIRQTPNVRAIVGSIIAQLPASTASTLVAKQRVTKVKRALRIAR